MKLQLITLYNSIGASLLFIPSIASSNWDELQKKCFVLMLLYAAAFLATMFDVVFGVIKSISIGLKPTSFRFRDTVTKLIRYFNLLILFTIVDFIISLQVDTPYFTIAGCFYIVFIEIKSWFEKASEKEKKNIKTITTFLKNKDNVAKILAELTEDELNNNSNGKNKKDNSQN